jgi:hypothetical protein
VTRPGTTRSTGQWNAGAYGYATSVNVNPPAALTAIAQ